MEDKCTCDLKTAKDLYDLAVDGNSVSSAQENFCLNRDNLSVESGKNTECCGIVPNFILWRPDSPGLECRLGEDGNGAPVIFDVVEESVVKKM